MIWPLVWQSTDSDTLGTRLMVLLVQGQWYHTNRISHTPERAKSELLCFAELFHQLVCEIDPKYWPEIQYNMTLRKNALLHFLIFSSHFLAATSNSQKCKKLPAVAKLRWWNVTHRWRTHTGDVLYISFIILDPNYTGCFHNLSKQTSPKIIHQAWAWLDTFLFFKLQKLIFWEKALFSTKTASNYCFQVIIFSQCWTLLKK